MSLFRAWSGLGCRSAILGIAIAFWVAAPAYGLVTLYSDQASFLAAINGYPSATEPFNSTGLQPTTHVVSTDGGIAPTSGVLPGSVWGDSVSRLLGETTTFSYTPSNTLFGAGAFFDTSPGNEGQGLHISASSHTIGQFDIATGLSNIDGGFFGWTTSVEFDSFTISAGPYAGGLESFNMDNLTFAALPEPSSFATLAVVSVLVLGLARRRHGSGAVATSD
jgi:hypothetical protein